MVLISADGNTTNPWPPPDRTLPNTPPSAPTRPTSGAHQARTPHGAAPHPAPPIPAGQRQAQAGTTIPLDGARRRIIIPVLVLLIPEQQGLAARIMHMLERRQIRLAGQQRGKGGGMERMGMGKGKDRHGMMITGRIRVWGDLWWWWC